MRGWYQAVFTSTRVTVDRGGPFSGDLPQNDFPEHGIGGTGFLLFHKPHTSSHPESGAAPPTGNVLLWGGVSCFRPVFFSLRHESLHGAAGRKRGAKSALSLSQ
jgi:hypothetical protein